MHLSEGSFRTDSKFPRKVEVDVHGDGLIESPLERVVSRELPLSLPESLIKAGATVVEELSYSRNRAKVSGYMWAGKLTLELDGITYFFEMWYHHSYEEDMVDSMVYNQLGLRAVEVKLKADAVKNDLDLFEEDKNFKYYDAYWYVMSRDTFIALNTKGWVGSQDEETLELKEFVESFRREIRPNPHYVLTAEHEEQLKAHGFEILFKASN